MPHPGWPAQPTRALRERPRAMAEFMDQVARQPAVQGLLHRRPGAEVVSGAEIRSLIGFERQKQLLGCKEDSSCIAEMGGALGASGFVLVAGPVVVAPRRPAKAVIPKPVPGRGASPVRKRTAL